MAEKSLVVTSNERHINDSLNGWTLLFRQHQNLVYAQALDYVWVLSQVPYSGTGRLRIHQAFQRYLSKAPDYNEHDIIGEAH